MKEGRRETIQDIGTVVSGAFLPYQDVLHSDVMERLARVRTKPSSLDAETLQPFKATTQSYRFLFVRGLVATPCLLEPVTEHFNLVVQLLKGSLLPSTRTALSAIASETAQFTGHLALDMDLDEQAQGYHNLALVIAEEANNDALFATVLGRVGWLKNLTGHPEEAIVYLEEAQRIALQRDVYTLVCWLAAKQTEAHADQAVRLNAEQPDDRDCLRALEMAQTFAERIQPGEETFGLRFNSSRLAAYQGSCYMRLQRPHLARPALLSALRMPEPAQYTQAILLDLATTSMQEQEIERTCSYIQQSLDLILPTHTMRQLHRVRTLRQQLEPWAAVEAVRNLDERLHASLPDTFLRKEEGEK
jgi:tetratricopeptide (TPR) repeat protein